MGTLVKLSIAAVVIGAGWWLLDQGKLIADQFGFKVVGYGTPSINGTTIDLPVNVQFNNPTSIPVNIDNVEAEIFINKNGWVNVGSVNQPLSIAAGLNTATIKTQIDLGKILGGNLIQTFEAVAADISQKSLAVRTEVTVTYAGVKMPTQIFNQNVQIG